MAQYTHLVIPDDSYGWLTLPHCLPGEALVTQSVDEAMHLLSTRPVDSIFAALSIGSEPLIRFFSDIRTDIGFVGTIYIFTQVISDPQITELARVGIDGIVLWEDVPPDLLPSLCTILGSCAFHIGSPGPSAVFLDQVRQQRILGTVPNDITQREQQLLKVWFHTEWDDTPPTRQQLAETLGISLSTLQREIRSLYTKLGAADDLTLGLEATRRGLLP